MSSQHLKRIVVISTSLIFIFGLSYYFWQKRIPLISPIAFIESIYLPPTKSKKVVYGFLPYWNLKYADTLQINHLTHLAYFAIDLNEDGTINKKVNKVELEPGWNKLNSDVTAKILYQSKLLKQKTVLTVTAMDPKLISSIVNSPEYSSLSFSSILDVYKNFNFDGINIDFEYVGEPDDTTINNFTIYIKNLKSQCIKISPDCFIDIDVFGDSASKKRLWNLTDLNAYVDHVIVMAYDYYRKSSTQAGPVAPLTGSCKGESEEPCLEQDILQHLSLFTKKIDQGKIILGIPFYGYEWQTASENFLANTYPKTGRIATYQRLQELIQNPSTASLSAKWSSTTLSPYLVYYDKKDIQQIHYENQQSLKLKMDVIKATNLGGVGIWALGYEVPYQDIWQPIVELNK
jgi:spore germination protein YaaH